MVEAQGESLLPWEKTRGGLAEGVSLMSASMYGDREHIR